MTKHRETSLSVGFAVGKEIARSAFGGDIYPTSAKSRSVPRQSVKTESSLATTRGLFGGISDEYRVYICLRRAYRRSGVHRGLLGRRRSSVVRVCHHRPVLGCRWCMSHRWRRLAKASRQLATVPSTPISRLRSIRRRRGDHAYPRLHRLVGAPGITEARRRVIEN